MKEHESASVGWDRAIAMLFATIAAAAIACSSDDGNQRVAPAGAASTSSSSSGGSGGGAGSAVGTNSSAGGASSTSGIGGFTGMGGVSGAGGSGNLGGGGASDAGARDAADQPSDGGDGGKPPTGSNCQPGGTGYEYVQNSEVVVDRRTCLVWQRIDPPKPASCPITADNPNGFCWLEAVKYCQALRLDGQSDWRLPTKDELLVLVDPDVGKSPRIDTSAFPSAQVSVYWTSTEVNADHAWGVDFANGMANSNIGKTGAQATRCVRGTSRDR